MRDIRCPWHGAEGAPSGQVIYLEIPEADFWTHLPLSSPSFGHLGQEAQAQGCVGKRK